MKIGYLIIGKDTHSDDEYQFRWKKEDAILIAENALAEAAIYYRLSPEEINRTDCDGKWGLHFSAGDPYGAFRISVREILVPPHVNMRLEQ